MFFLNDISKCAKRTQMYGQEKQKYQEDKAGTSLQKNAEI